MPGRLVAVPPYGPSVLQEPQSLVQVLQALGGVNPQAQGVLPVEHAREADALDHLGQVLAVDVFLGEHEEEAGLCRQTVVAGGQRTLDLQRHESTERRLADKADVRGAVLCVRQVGHALRLPDAGPARLQAQRARPVLEEECSVLGAPAAIAAVFAGHHPRVSETI